MSGRPITIPTWATDTNYPNDGGPDANTATKVDPGAVRARGWRRDDLFFGQFQNKWQNEVGAWLSYLQNIKVTNWTPSPARVSTPAAGLTGVTYNATAGYWLVCGAAGYTYRSISGRDFWTANAQLDAGHIDFNGIATSDAGLTIAVGDITSGGTVAFSSTDGTAWTSRALTWNNSNAICWDQTNATFIIAADTGIFTMTAAFATAQRLLSGAPKNAVATNPAGLSVAVGDGGTVNSSSNATVWTSRTHGGGAGDFKAVMWDAVRGLFVVGGAAGVVMTSPDAITWTVLPTAFGGAEITYLANDGGHWVAGTEGATIGYSGDGGATWAGTPLENAGGLAQVINGIGYAQNQFVLGTSAGYIHTSLRTP